MVRFQLLDQKRNRYFFSDW